MPIPEVYEALLEPFKQSNCQIQDVTLVLHSSSFQVVDNHNPSAIGKAEKAQC